MDAEYQEFITAGNAEVFPVKILPFDRLLDAWNYQLTNHEASRAHHCLPMLIDLKVLPTCSAASIFLSHFTSCNVRYTPRYITHISLILATRFIIYKKTAQAASILLLSFIHLLHSKTVCFCFYGPPQYKQLSSSFFAIRCRQVPKYTCPVRTCTTQ